MTLCIATASWAGNATNQQMLLDEMEPYGDQATTLKISAKKMDNLYMLQAELEPYGEAIVKRSMRVVQNNLANMRMLMAELEPYGDIYARPDIRTRANAKMSPRKYANLCMMCDEIE
jgi:hypothetical protein